MKTVTTIATTLTILSSLLAGCSGDFESVDGGMPMSPGTGATGSELDSGSGSVGSVGSVGETGGDTTMGSGGESSETGGSSAGGTDGTGGNDPVATGGRVENCIPYTCDEITYMESGDIIDAGLEGSACGAHDDGCGGVAICDTTCDCGGRRNQKMNSPNDSGVIEGTDGICGSSNCLDQGYGLAIEYCDAQHTPDNGWDVHVVTCPTVEVKPEGTIVDQIHHAALPENGRMFCVVN